MTDSAPIKQAQRIQTSFINGIERKALVWLAERQPRWMTSDMLTGIGIVGAFLVGLGFVLTRYDIHWLWLSCAGLVINWYGDSLDGTLARVRQCQRPIYGYYLDHTIDCVNEAFMFIGAGLSPLLNFNLALLAFILYLFMTINVSINAHLKSEFRLTYAKLGPTEFRLLIIIACIVVMSFPSLATYYSVNIAGIRTVITTLDIVALFIIVLLTVIYIASIISDARKYAAIDPPKKYKQEK
ncbi:MAG: CDP-alcohol phosphatidyltransferase family protein [Bacteroidales bacterium]|nr:CDP-alcohol phosphatidyltransferase family protein [Bacteroidales bacterium]